MIRVIVVEPQVMFRQSLKVYLEKDGFIEIVAEASTADEAFERIATIPCDVVLMSLQLTGRDGIRCVRDLRRRSLKVRVLLLSTLTDDAVVRDAVGAGVNGFISRHASCEELAHALQEIHAGGFYLHRMLAEPFLEGLRT